MRESAFSSAYALARFCGRSRLVSCCYGLIAVRAARRSAKLEYHGRKRVGL
jgi:hypothetical protein